MPAVVRSQAEAEQADAADPLGAFPDRFVVADPTRCYLDGNSLGRLPRDVAERLADVVERQWGEELVEAWEHWIDLPRRLGDRLAQGVLGAAPGSTVVADSTTVNLYKLLDAACALQRARQPARRVLVIEADNFPSDRDVVGALARRWGLELRVVPVDPVEGPTPSA